MRWHALMVVVSASALAISGCKGGEGDEGSGGSEGSEPVPVEPGEFTYTLDESPEGLTLWTTPATRKLRTSDRAPAETRSGLELSAARGEFEPI